MYFLSSGSQKWSWVAEMILSKAVERPPYRSSSYLDSKASGATAPYMASLVMLPSAIARLRVRKGTLITLRPDARAVKSAADFASARQPLTRLS